MMNDPWTEENRQAWSLIDGRQVGAGKEFSCDVVIVGSGAGGAVAAAELAKAGLKIALVEDGDLYTHRDFGKSELSAFGKLYQENGSRMTKDRSITMLQGRAVGGSTVINWTSSFHLPADTLEHWKNYHSVQWNEQDLKVHYQAIEDRLNIHQWTVPPNPNNAILKKGLETLGVNAKTIPRNVRSCLNLGYCGLGCPVNAKQSMVITFVPDALDLGASLYFNSFASRLIFTNRQVTAVECRPSTPQGQQTGESFIIKGRYFIVSAGAIGSPALLLRSQVPDPNGRIGANTCLHPTVLSGAVMPELVEGFHGAPQSIYSDDYLKADPAMEPIGFKLETAPIFPVVFSALIPTSGKTHRRIMTLLPKVQATIALLRDGFNEESGGRVSIDAKGAPIVDYKWTNALSHGAKRALMAMAELQFAAGAQQVYPLHMDALPYRTWSEAKKQIQSLDIYPPALRIVSAHIMGGCAMGSEDKGVVNDRGKFYGLDNLTVADGSIFPTSLGANPQLSIYALVHYISAQLIKELR